MFVIRDIVLISEFFVLQQLYIIYRVIYKLYLMMSDVIVLLFEMGWVEFLKDRVWWFVIFLKCFDLFVYFQVSRQEFVFFFGDTFFFLGYFLVLKVVQLDLFQELLVIGQSGCFIGMCYVFSVFSFGFWCRRIGNRSYLLGICFLLGIDLDFLFMSFYLFFSQLYCVLFGRMLGFRGVICLFRFFGE